MAAHTATCRCRPLRTIRAVPAPAGARNPSLACRRNQNGWPVLRAFLSLYGSKKESSEPFVRCSIVGAGAADESICTSKPGLAGAFVSASAATAGPEDKIAARPRSHTASKARTWIDPPSKPGIRAGRGKYRSQRLVARTTRTRHKAGCSRPGYGPFRGRRPSDPGFAERVDDLPHDGGECRMLQLQFHGRPFEGGARGRRLFARAAQRSLDVVR